MSEDLNLISSCLFREKEYVLSLKLIASHTLDVKVTDKISGEVWAGSYDCTYIENLTHKTGNFKQFDVFLSMLRSGFLKTSDSIALDLLSYEDLEALRSLRKGTASFYSTAASSSNKRYLIVTYSVEFDRIHYPLPLDYCGPPNPLLLQATVRKLEGEVTRLREVLDKRNSSKEWEPPGQAAIVRDLENRLKELTVENDRLTQDIEELTSHLSKQQIAKPSHSEMRRTIRIIEEQVERERQSFQEQVRDLQSRNQELLTQLDECQKSEAYLQTQLKHLKAPTDRKTSPLTGSRRTRIRRNKYQLPPLPDRIPVREKNRLKVSPTSGMMGDNVNIRALPRRPTGRTLTPRIRHPSESSVSTARSSSLDSRKSNVSLRRKDSRNCKTSPRSNHQSPRNHSLERKVSRNFNYSLGHKDLRNLSPTKVSKNFNYGLGHKVSRNSSPRNSNTTARHKDARSFPECSARLRGARNSHGSPRHSPGQGGGRGKERGVGNSGREKSGGKTLAVKDSSLSSKGSEKSTKTTLKKIASINTLKPLYSSCESFHSGSEGNVISKKSSSDIENRIRALQRLLKDNAHL